MATALTSAAPCKTFIVSIDPRSKSAVQLMNALKLMDFLKIEESPYDSKYVAEVKVMDKRTFKSVKRDKLWE